MKQEKYEVSGMTCSACSTRVEKCVAGLKGVDTVSVNLLTNSMQVSYDEQIQNADGIIQVVENAGYGAAVRFSAADKQKKESASNAKAGSQKIQTGNMKKRLVLSFIFLIPMMYISMHHMLYEWLSIPVPQIVVKLFHGEENALAFSFSQFLLLLPIMYLNQNYFVIGFKNLFYHHSPNMDSLIAIGAGASVIYGIFAIFRIGYGLGHQDMLLVSQYSSDIYFESAGMILTLITLGKYLESRSKKKTSEAIEHLMGLAPMQATVLRDEKEMLLPIDEVVIGDVIVVRPGESVPVDGVIIEGQASLDESALTGESIPVFKQPGDTVISASMNQNGMIKCRASRVGEDTTISQIIKLVEEAGASKAPIARLADKIAGIFVPVVISIAAIAGIIWFISGAGFEFSLSIVIAVLVISCPCALGLATPVAIMVGTGKGAEHGILIKSGEALETAHKVDTVVMDKTGTITEGKPVVTDIKTLGIAEEQLLSIAFSIEQGSSHPLALAITEYGRAQNCRQLPLKEYESVMGRGICAKSDSNLYYAGNEAFMTESGVDITGIETICLQYAEEGKTPMLFADEKKVLGIIAVADTEKPTSKLAVAAFRKMHINVIMLTGDREQTANALQKRLHISQVIANVLPQDKERHIARLQEKGHIVAMIGDGINDAPALAKADVGIAIGAGTEIAIESADAVLMRNDLMDAVTAIRLSKAVILNIKENLFWAFFYNCIGIPLAAGVLYPMFGLKLSPMFGAAAMSLSSVCVVCNALRLKLFQTDNKSRDQLEKEKKMKKTLKIEGMMCEHCKKHVEDALNGIDGVCATVDLEQKQAVVEMEHEISGDEFKSVITKAGYELKDIM